MRNKIRAWYEYYTLVHTLDNLFRVYGIPMDHKCIGSGFGMISHACTHLSYFLFEGTVYRCVSHLLLQANDESKPKKWKRRSWNINTHSISQKRYGPTNDAYMYTEKILQLTWNYGWQNGYTGSLMTFEISKLIYHTLVQRTCALSNWVISRSLKIHFFNAFVYY